MNIHKIAKSSETVGRYFHNKILVTDTRIVVTDGYCLVVTPNSRDVAPGVYTAESFGKNEKDPAYPLALSTDERDFPDYQRLLDDRDAITTLATVSLDAKLLLAIAEAMRESKHDTHKVVLETAGNSAIRIRLVSAVPTIEDRVALLMPCYVK